MAHLMIHQALHNGNKSIGGYVARDSGAGQIDRIIVYAIKIIVRKRNKVDYI